MDQYIGKMLDNRYEILECIGTGGMAVVYKARCHRLNRLVAVKILKPELASDAEFRRRFHDESQAVAMLSNANIVSVYDVSRSDGLDYIVMELVDGLTLKQYMQRRGTPLNWREAQHFITQIMRALSHAHSRGIIHRDIKPHNIMVLRDGSVKVTDFGIAQLASAAQNTMTQEAIGSVHYISPEQARGSHVDCRTDIYSAGVVLYEMLTGRLPFEGDTPMGVAIQHIQSIPVPPKSLNPDIPQALEDITMKAMAPDLNQRYGSADEMLEDLKEFRKNPDMEVAQPEVVDEPTMVVPITRNAAGGMEGRRETAQDTGRNTVRRERRYREVEADAYEEYADTPRRGSSAAPAVAAIVVILIFIGGMLFFLYNFMFKGMFEDKKEYPVPSLLGYTLEELEKNPAILGQFKYEEGDTIYSEEYAEGEICGQTPESGTVAREGELVIKVTISGGEDKMYMPPVDGWDARQALVKLQNEMGLDVEVQEEFSDTITKGIIISYTPMAEKIVEKGDKVVLVVSKGPETPKVAVPSFLDMNFEDVERQLGTMGLIRGKVDQHYSTEYAEGKVIWQSVLGEVDKNTVIDFWVSLGPEETEPPVTEPPVTEPPVTEPPATETPSIPTENVGVPASTQFIDVDLSGFEGTVNVRIQVGDQVIFDGSVDASTGVLSKPATASGVQTVSIYINNVLDRSYSLSF